MFEVIPDWPRNKTYSSNPKSSASLKPTSPGRTLREFLFAEYGRPFDRSVTRQSLFVDDLRSNDQSHLFCRVSVELDDSEKFLLKLQNAPVSEALREFVQSEGGSIQETVYGSVIVLNFAIRQSARITELAKAVRHQIGRGQKYDDSNWRWVCPRTADSLQKLAKVLWSYRSAKRQGQV